MKIQSILERVGGTKADIDGIEYHFEPLADGAHVAEVEREAHIDRFLSISEAYKVYHGKGKPEGKPVELEVAAPKAKQTHSASTGGRLEGSSVHAAGYDIGGKTVPLFDIITAAFLASGLTSDEWNELDDEDRHAKIDIALDDMAEAAEKAEVAAPEAEVDERAVLVAAYEAKFGKKPHYRASAETIKAQIEGE